MHAKQTLILLVILTLLTAGLAGSDASFRYIAVAIMLLSSVKFLLVAFQFMELRKAHIFWKSLIIGFVAVFDIVILSATLS